MKIELIKDGYQRCVVCGTSATHKHISIMGSIPFYVCKGHYMNTSSAFGSGRMGLTDSKTCEWINMPYFKMKNYEHI